MRNVQESMTVICTGRPWAPKNIGLLKTIQNLGEVNLKSLAKALPKEDDQIDLSGRLRGMAKRGYVCVCRREGPRQPVYSITSAGTEVIQTSGARVIKSPGVSSKEKAAEVQVKHYLPTVYQGQELRPYQGRPGAMDAFALPSRMGQRLHYRDGRVELIEQTTGAAA
ncbi:hypothetical protein PSQ39_21280 [Curvibacter sp. HBC28]|uniref:HTH hxlR-type domain-containing protein n=1 Tax=Curvibacter microcysteis TaxID=3026419 RepID=A0ABT5MKR3_9BURK|nr:hypothetical protein [Curvibacter sp. HBC28]MDD0817181.1 hypothetical protein [Curvibacter sp. HBC28]